MSKGNRSAGRSSNTRIERDYWVGDRFSCSSSRGYNYHIYLLKDSLNTGIYKIGISNDPHRRVEEINHRVRINSFKHNFIIKSSVFIGEEKEAVNIEQSLLSFFTNKIYSDRNGFEGNTEVRNLTEHDVEKILNIFERLRHEKKRIISADESIQNYTPPVAPLELIGNFNQIRRERPLVNPVHEAFEKEVIQPCLKGFDIHYTTNHFLYGYTKGLHAHFYIESLRLALMIINTKQGVKTAMIEGDVSKKHNCIFVKFRLNESIEVKCERLSLWIKKRAIITR